MNTVPDIHKYKYKYAAEVVFLVSGDPKTRDASIILQSRNPVIGDV